MARSETQLRRQVLTRSVSRARMAPALRFTLYGVCGLLWLTGALWLMAHFLFPLRNEFGTLPNPAEPGLMRLHGVLAVVGVFLLGWIAAEHVPAGWTRALNRLSGLWLAAFAILLVASGYALYYSTGGLHDGAAAVHEVLGIAALIAALAHWLKIRGSR